MKSRWPWPYGMIGLRECTSQSVQAVRALRRIAGWLRGQHQSFPPKSADSRLSLGAREALSAWQRLRDRCATQPTAAALRRDGALPRPDGLCRLRSHYPELAAETLVEVDIIDDGETLFESAGLVGGLHRRQSLHRAHPGPTWNSLQPSARAPSPGNSLSCGSPPSPHLRCRSPAHVPGAHCS